LRKSRTCAGKERYLPDNIYAAIENFRKAEWTTKLLGEDVKTAVFKTARFNHSRIPPFGA
jgi:glutamine synthetase